MTNLSGKFTGDDEFNLHEDLLEFVNGSSHIQSTCPELIEVAEDTYEVCAEISIVAYTTVLKEQFDE